MNSSRFLDNIPSVKLFQYEAVFSGFKPWYLLILMFFDAMK